MTARRAPPSRVPNGWTLDGDGHTITAYDPAGGHFRGAVVANAGAVANVRRPHRHGLPPRRRLRRRRRRLRGILLDGASGVIAEQPRRRPAPGRQRLPGGQRHRGRATHRSPSGGRDVVRRCHRQQVRGYQKAGIVVNGSVRPSSTATRCRVSAWCPTSRRTACRSASAATACLAQHHHGQLLHRHRERAGLRRAVLPGRRRQEKQNTFSGNQRNVCKVKPPKAKKDHHQHQQQHHHR